MNIYVLRLGTAGETIGAFRTPSAAKGCADAREGVVQQWHESNSHGRMWKVVAPQMARYVIEETSLSET